MAPVIIAKDLYKCYPGFPPVLRGVDISVEPGEMAAIMGPSGCGKSTMLHVLGMLHAPDSGSLEILGTNVLGMNQDQTAAFRRGNMGFVMQASNLFEHSTVFENVEFPLIYENVPPQERWERVIRALDLVHLSARVHYRSNRLSGGEQQRVAIARAMVNNPRILLADEPTGALDARTSRLIMENFRRLCHSGGVSMIMVTHDPKMAEFCDSIYTLDDGILNCKKHEKPPLAQGGNINFLKPPEPLARGALIAVRFPDASRPDLQDLAARMNSMGLLARIYGLARNGLFNNPEGYALPLPVHAMSWRQRLFSLGAFFHQARGSESLWSLWRKLPPHGPEGSSLRRRVIDFACGAELARWGIADNIQLFYAAGAEHTATAAWVGARIIRKSFAFALRPDNIPHFGADWRAKANDAVFISCSTNAVLDAARKLLPDISSEKFVLLRDPLAEKPSSEEIEARRPALPGQPVTILAPGASISPANFKMIVAAAAILKRLNVKFRLAFLGNKSFSQRWRLASVGLRGYADFRRWPATANIGEIFRGADIFLATPPGYSGGELDLPLYAREAMAYALPIITWEITPGLAEALKPDRNCLALQKNDPEELARVLSGLIGDMPRGLSLGNAAREDILALLAQDSVDRSLADLVVARVCGNERAKGQEEK